jgi:hypothetical protein
MLFDLSDLSDIGQSIFSGILNIFNENHGHSDQHFDIDMPDLFPDTSIDERIVHSAATPSFADSDTHHVDGLRFGDDLQNYQDELRPAKNLVDYDRRVVSNEQAEVDSINSRINSLSDMSNHEPNQDLAREYQNQISGLELDLSSHEHKLAQARADLSTHQAAEYQIEDKITEELNKSQS